MANLNMKIILNSNNRIKKNGTQNLYLRINFKNDLKRIPLGFSIDPKNFDNKKELAKGVDSLEINKRIQDIKKKYNDRYFELLQKGDFFSLSDIIQETEKKQYDLIEYIKEQAKYKKNNHGLNVAQEQQNAYKNLISNLQSFAGKRINFNKVSIKFINEFDLWLKNTPLNKGKVLHINTIRHRHDILRSFLELAVDDGLLQKNPYASKTQKKGFHYSGIESERDFLTETELNKIENMLPPDNTISFVKDLFLFGCYTGLRFADIMNLTTQNIFFDKDKIYLWLRENKTQKMKTNLPISKLFDGKAIEIIEKYKGKNKNKLFPDFTDQAVNRILKVIAIALNIPKKLTFHVARHTFATILLKKGISVAMVQKLMNHGRIDTTLRYIHILGLDIDNELDQIKW